MNVAGCLIGIDVGTTTVKAVATDVSGVRLAGTGRPTPVEHGSEGRTEHPGRLLRDAVISTLTDLIAQLGDRRPAGIAVTSMGEAGAFVDAAGQVVRAPIGWSDSRARPQIERLERQIDRDEIYRITGHVPDPSFGVARCMWIRDFEPEVFERARTWLSISDLVVFWLSGARVTDPSIASRTMALDQGTGDWSSRILAAAGIDRSLMPTVCPSGSVVGTVTDDIATLTGLPRGTPVVLGGHDRLCGAFGARAGADLAIDSAGTAESLVVSVPLAARAPSRIAAAEIACYRDVVPGRIAYSARVGIAGGLLDWLWRLSFARDGQTAPDFEAMMGDLPPLEGPPEIVCLPSFGRSIAPGAGQGPMRGTFVGLAEHHGRGDLLRACLEGPALSLRANLEMMESIIGRSLALRTEGGVSRNPVWMQIRADVLGRELESVEVADLTPMGAALLAGVGAGVFADHEEAGASLSIPRLTWAPRRDHALYYDSVYNGVFTKLAEAVGPLSNELLRARG